MKITHFKAAGVQGHLEFDLQFRDDFTFLIGLNGSGKTSALKLMMALLTPNLAELAQLAFEYATIRLVNAGQESDILVRKSAEGMLISVSEVDSTLHLSAAELQLLEQTPSPDDQKSPVLALALASPAIAHIIGLGTPMFLGIDRRFVAINSIREPSETKRRDFLVSRTLTEEMDIKRGNVAAGLADVNLLVHDIFSEIRGAQELLDAEFRDRLLTSAFDYKPATILELKPPSAESLNQYREMQAEIDTAVGNLQLPQEGVKNALHSFFDKMNKVASSLQRPSTSKLMRSPQPKRRGPDRYAATQPPEHLPPLPDASVIEWMINKPQVDRITAHLELLAQYNARRSQLRLPLDRFLSLLNSFLADTKKRVFVTERGALMVELPDGKPRSIGALSSGERQLVVMLGHLSLNKTLPGSGVFIVDEPELSLHISWQERFLDAIREANPSVQIVMATHSPAIILQRDDHCESLDRVEEADAPMAS